MLFCLYDCIPYCVLLCLLSYVCNLVRLTLATNGYLLTCLDTYLLSRVHQPVAPAQSMVSFTYNPSSINDDMAKDVLLSMLQISCIPTVEERYYGWPVCSTIEECYYPSQLRCTMSVPQ